MYIGGSESLGANVAFADMPIAGLQPAGTGSFMKGSGKKGGGGKSKGKGSGPSAPSPAQVAAPKAKSPPGPPPQSNAHPGVGAVYANLVHLTANLGGRDPSEVLEEIQGFCRSIMEHGGMKGSIHQIDLH